MKTRQENASAQQEAPTNGPVFSLEPSCHCGCFPKTGAEVHGWVVVGGLVGAWLVPHAAISTFWTRADDGSRLREGIRITVTSASLKAAASTAGLEVVRLSV